MIRTFLKLLWKRDSETCACLIIEVAELLSNRDLTQMAEYLKSLRQNRELSA